jgi:prepilin-type N-terminal cleavage/methylation domain-containing protein
MRRPSRSEARASGPAFTLVELLVVMAIIGILLAFILTAAMDGVRRAEERATQALIVKLDAGMTDRLDAIIATRADALASHDYMARIYLTSGSLPRQGIRNNMRAQIIARFDQIKAEIPDVFVLQLGNVDYPLNFAAIPYNPTDGTTSFIAPSLALSGKALNHYQYILPLGVACLNNPAFDENGNANAAPISYGADSPSNTLFPPTGTGIYGASYTAAAGLYKTLFQAAVVKNPGASGPTPQNAGYDGIDNNGNGLVDELSENGGMAAGMLTLLKNHQHKTARAEMLYALLVEGQGPFGSVFSRDDFSDSEVRDTDGDGLPEFIDAWGEPIQFYRWPIFFQSDTQRGAGGYTLAQSSTLSTYNVSYDPREQNTLDPNQTLVEPAWWSGAINSSSPFAAVTAPLSGSAIAFQNFFHTLTDPNANPGLATPALPGQVWDRGVAGSNYFARREYYSRFLIVSGGPDRAPGVPVFDPTYYTNVGQYYNGAGSPSGPILNVANLLIESQAGQGTPNRTPPYYSFPVIVPSSGPSYPLGDPTSDAIREAGNDDVSNHTIQAPGGATQ